MKNKKNRTKYFSLYIIPTILIITTVFFCLSLGSNLDTRMNESAKSNILNTTNVIVDTLVNYIEINYSSLSLVGDTYENKGTITSADLEAYRKTMELNWLGIVDNAGNGIDCNGNIYNINAYPSADEWDLYANGYSNVYVGQQSGRNQISMWTPIYNDNEDYVGTVLGNILVSQFYSANVFTFYEGVGRTYIFDSENGNWVLKSLGTDGTFENLTNIYALLEASGNSKQDIEAFKSIVTSGKAGSAMLNFNGEQSYLCFLPMPSSPGWYVSTVIARNSLLRESLEIRKLFILIVIVLILLQSIITFLFAWWVVKRTKDKEINYRDAMFSNISANLDSAFIIYEKSTKKTAFVSDNMKRLIGINQEALSNDVGQLFDFCKIPEYDEQRIAFIEGKLNEPIAREVIVNNELQQNNRIIRLELIPADLGQELAVLTDITKNKVIENNLLEAMERAEAASKTKDEFLSAMSHDLRTPINGVVGMATIAMANLENKQRVKDCLNKISSSTEHLLHLINEILDVSQFEGGKVELNNEAFNIADLLQNVLNVSYPGIREKQHKVSVNVSKMEHEEVIGDPVRLTRVMMNLISNAIKYTPQGGKINLSIEEKATVIHGFGCYEIIVEDNGIGMSKEFQKKVFEPFEREDTVQMLRIQGTGLGMSIVKNTVDLMMGNIQVQSEKDQGTKYTITINLKLNDQASIPLLQYENLEALIIDDDQEACNLIKATLEGVGIKCQIENDDHNIPEAIKAYYKKENPYFVIILGQIIKDVDGWLLAKNIKEQFMDKSPYIIMVKDEISDYESEQADLIIDDYITKPLYKSKIIMKVKAYIDAENKQKEPQNVLAICDSLSNKRILLVEDNELNREIAMEFLMMMNIRVDCAENGAEAIECLKKTPSGTYDLILMDIQMPILNGYEATKKIRALGQADSKTIPIVAMTADAFNKDIKKALEAGMDEHISKPISIESLLIILKKFLVD